MKWLNLVLASWTSREPVMKLFLMTTQLKPTPIPMHFSIPLVIALVLMPLGATLPLFAETPARQPNIIFLFADDMGWGDLHCYGHPYAKTPNLDQLAKDGTRFQQCYATGVTCCPSRTGFMTSKFPATFAKYPANGGFGDRMTVTELLKKQGYVTGHFGKWHIGPETKAGTYGIDVIGTEEGEPGNKRRIATSGRCRSAPIYDAAIQFIEKHQDRPFYINVWDHIPHHPVNPSPPLVEAFGPLQVDESQFSRPMQEKFALCRKQGGDVSVHMRNWLAEIRAMDEEIGRLLTRLDELGLRQNTLVVFSSDQGPASIRDPDEEKQERSMSPRKEARQAKKADSPSAEPELLRLNAMGYAGPFRGGKHAQYEGGIRIPFLVRWPGHVPAGRVDADSVISGADWLPTLCGIVGQVEAKSRASGNNSLGNSPAATSDNSQGFDGEDVSKALFGGTHRRTKPLLWKTSSTQSMATIREGEWKLHYPNSRRGEMQLYNVLTDPGEEHNLVNERADIVKQLAAKVESWQATLPKEYDKGEDRDTDN